MLEDAKARVEQAKAELDDVTGMSPESAVISLRRSVEYLVGANMLLIEELEKTKTRAIWAERMARRALPVRKP